LVCSHARSANKFLRCEAQSKFQSVAFFLGRPWPVREIKKYNKPKLRSEKQKAKDLLVQAKSEKLRAKNEARYARKMARQTPPALAASASL
jgi:hypothetical protein